MITVAGGFALMMIVFVILAIIFAVLASETRSSYWGKIYARYGFIALGWAVGSALTAIWLAVAGL